MRELDARARGREREKPHEARGDEAPPLKPGASPVAVSCSPLYFFSANVVGRLNKEYNIQSRVRESATEDSFSERGDLFSAYIG